MIFKVQLLFYHNYYHDYICIAAGVHLWLCGGGILSDRAAL